MRNYLQNLNIVGTSCIWNEGDICKPYIDKMIEHCDKVVLSLDHTEGYTLSIVEDYIKRYPDIVTARQHENMPPIVEGVRIMGRHKHNQGGIRDCALRLVKEEHDKRPIDILLFFDSDELPTDNLQNLLQGFWEDKKVDVIFIKPLEVYDDMHIIINQGLVSHARIYKYLPEITALPYSQQTFYQPYRKWRTIWKRSYNFVHLARLTKENRELRNRLRLGESHPDLKLKRVSKPANTLTPEEGAIITNDKRFLRLGDYDGDINKIPLIL